MMELLSKVDSQLLLYLNGIHSDLGDYIMWFITIKWTWVPLYIVILLTILKNQSRYTAIIVILSFLLVIVYSDQICSSLLRPYFHRLRPSHPDSGISALLHLVNGYRGGTYGLPSCHSANSFGLAFFMVLMFRNRMLSISILFWAVLNSYSRIYLGVHYPSDLIAGLLVGLSGAVLIYYLLKGVLNLQIHKSITYASLFPNWSNRLVYPIIACLILSLFLIVSVSVYCTLLAK